MVRQNINDAVEALMKARQSAMAAFSDTDYYEEAEEFKKGFNGCVEALADYTWKYINGALTIR